MRPPPALPARGPERVRGSARWGSLDVLRGVALFLMVAHHFAEWTGGHARDRIIGFDGMAVTDLAAPMFAVGVGSAAYLVGSLIPPWGGGGRARAARTSWRWTQVLLAGVVIDIAVGGGIDGGGVLPTLAVVGAATTALAAVGVRHPAAWWVAAAGCAALAPAALAVDGGGFFTELLNGTFSVVVYQVFAAAGAAVAAHAATERAGEQRLPLVSAALATAAVGAAATWLLGDWLAPGGVWPPDRHPGDLAFLTWGLAASFALWAALRWLVPADGALGAALARAGRRTLLLFVGHYVVKLALQHSDLLGTLDSWRWGIVAWLAAGVVCVAATVPSSAQRSRATP